jgi:tetratricopeptide (TPR) repeat protein
MNEENNKIPGIGSESGEARADEQSAATMPEDTPADNTGAPEAEDVSGDAALFEADTQPNMAADILIQELPDIETYADGADDEDEGEKFYCARCEREVPEHVTLCAECEAIIKKYPFSSNAIFLFVVAVFISVAGLIIAAANFPIVVNVIKGNSALQSGDLKKCYEYYDEAYSFVSNLNMPFSASLPTGYSLFSSGNKTLVNQFIAINRLNGPYQTGQYIEKYFGENVPSKLAGIKKEYDEIAKAAELMNNGFDGYYSAVGEEGEATYGGLMTVIDKIVSENDIPDYLVIYYRFLAAKETGEDMDVALRLMDSIIAEKPEAFWLYASDAVSLYKQSGDFAKALSICNNILKIDPTDSSAIAYSMSILRMDGNYNGALTVYEKAMKIIDTTPEIERQRAIVLMLQGNFEDAEKILIENYDESTLTVEYAETLCACALKTGNTEKFDEVCSLLAGYGIQLSESLQKLQSGETTIEKIYLEGTGDPV